MYCNYQKSKGYYIHVATEAAGFAWKEPLSDVFISIVIPNLGPDNALGIWFVVVICFCILICASTAIQSIFIAKSIAREAMTTSNEEMHGNLSSSSGRELKTHHHLRRKKVLEYESETFALSIAYLFTIVAISLACGTQFSRFAVGASQDDDMVTTADSSYCGDYILDILFPLVLTFIVGFAQAYVLEKDDDLKANTEVVTECKTAEEEEEKENDELENEEENGDAAAVDASDHARGETACDSSIAVMSTTQSDDELQSSNSASSSSSMRTMSTFYIEDSSGSARIIAKKYFSFTSGPFWRDAGHALLTLANKSFGYLVGCAWFTWTVITFQGTLFAYDNVVSLLVASILVTYLGVRYMTSVTMKYDALGVKNPRAVSRMRIKRALLRITSARLTVGWMWEEFVMSLLRLLFVGRRRTVSMMWASAALRVAVAVVVTVLGANMESRRLFARQRTHEAVASLLPNFTSSSPMTSMGNLMSRLSSRSMSSTAGAAAASSSAVPADTAVHGQTGDDPEAQVHAPAAIHIMQVQQQTAGR